MNSLLRALGAIGNISSDEGEGSCFFIRNGKLDTKSWSRQTKSSKENSVYSSFTFVLREKVFSQGMVVLLNPVCVILSGMLHVCKSHVSVVVFKT